MHEDLLVPPTIRLLYGAVKYVLSDQEKEGRKLAIEVVADVYKPIRANLQKRDNKLIAIIEDEKTSYYAKVDDLETLYKHYEAEEKKLQHRIYTLSTSSKRAKKISKTMGINLKAISETSAHSACNLCTANFININKFSSTEAFLLPFVKDSTLLSLFLYGDYFDKLADKKRKKYYKIEYRHQCKLWQKKIDEMQTDINERIKKLDNIKAENEIAIKDLKNLLKGKIKDYTLEYSQYIILKKATENK